MSCQSCESGFDHCHGTLVEHVAGFVECTDDCVDVDVVRHALVITCESVERTCGCAVMFTDDGERSANSAAEYYAEFARAS